MIPSIILCIIRFPLLVMQDLHQDTLSIRLKSLFLSLLRIGWTCKISLGLFFFPLGQERIRIPGFWNTNNVLDHKRKVKSPLSDKAQLLQDRVHTSTSVTHEQQLQTLKQPINPIRGRQLPGLMGRMTASARLCLRNPWSLFKSQQTISHWPFQNAENQRNL